MWNAETGEKVHTLEGHTDWVDSVCYSADGKQIVSLSKNENIVSSLFPWVCVHSKMVSYTNDDFCS